MQTKKVLAGYSNIPLLLMKYKAEKAGRNGMFVDFPKGRFDVPSDLSRIKDTFMKEIENLCSGRKWLFPEVRTALMNIESLGILISIFLQQIPFYLQTLQLYIHQISKMV